MSNLAPIVLFVYNRLDHTKQTIEALQKNELAERSELFIYSDAARDQNAERNVDKVRSYIDRVDGFKKVTIVKREKNWGLANSIINGVTNVVNEYGKVIVLEDDLLTSPYFLKFMNEALKFYDGVERVYSVSGYSFTDNVGTIDNTYFLSLTSSWGWATWKDKWKDFNRDTQELKKYIDNKSNIDAFNFNNSYDYVGLAQKQLDCKLDSWAIFWYFSVLQKKGLTLYPSKSLVSNIGFDGSGVHCGISEVEKKLNFTQFILTEDIWEKEINRITVANILNSNKKSKVDKIKLKLKKILTNYQKNRIYLIISKFKLFFSKKNIGKNSYIDKTVNVLGWSHVSIGENSLIGEYSWININNKIKGFKHIEIGNNCYLGKRTCISSAKKIVIKDYCLIGDDCKIIGANHKYENPLIPYVISGASSEENISIGVNVWLGTMICVIGNVSIGYGSIIGSGSIVTKDIPPFSIAVGNPCKVVKRYNFKNNKWIEINFWDDLLEKYFPSEDEYLKQMNNNVLDTKMYRYAASHRFGNLI